MTLKRTVNEVEDGGAIDNIVYNSESGAKKTVEVGPALTFVGVTTNEVAIVPGSQLFLFKTDAAVGYVKLAAVTGVGVPGAAPAADTFPVQPMVYTQIAASDYKFIRGSASIYLYKLKDSSVTKVNP